MSAVLNLSAELVATPATLSKIAAALPAADPATRDKLLSLINTALAFHDAAAAFCPANDSTPAEVQPVVTPEPIQEPATTPQPVIQVVHFRPAATPDPTPANCDPIPDPVPAACEHGSHNWVMGDAVARVLVNLPRQPRRKSDLPGWFQVIRDRLSPEYMTIDGMFPAGRPAGNRRGRLRQEIATRLGISTAELTEV